MRQPCASRRRSPLELTLLGWACDHWPDPVDAIEAHWGDWEYERRCLGAIFRRAAAADPAWFYRVCTACPREVVALGPYIREIRWEALGGLPAWGAVPGRLGWAQYVRSLQVVEWIQGPSDCPLPPPPHRSDPKPVAAVLAQSVAAPAERSLF